jgi:hypothetical protein
MSCRNRRRLADFFMTDLLPSFMAAAHCGESSAWAQLKRAILGCARSRVGIR